MSLLIIPTIYNNYNYNFINYKVQIEIHYRYNQLIFIYI